MIISGSVNKMQVKGKTHKDFALNYLSELVKQKKDLPDKERLCAYIEYFVEIGHYDQSRRDKIIYKNKKNLETLTKSKQQLTEFLQTGNGVCQQFAQALALVCAIDENLKANYCGCRIKAKDIEMGHAINVVILENKGYIVDLSSLIHIKEEDYKTSPENFKFVTLEEYLENAKKANFEILSSNINNKERKDDRYLTAISQLPKDYLGTYYYLLNLPADDINEKYQNFLYNIWPIPRKESTLTNNNIEENET